MLLTAKRRRMLGVIISLASSSLQPSRSATASSLRLSRLALTLSKASIGSVMLLTAKRRRVLGVIISLASSSLQPSRSAIA